jgi:UDP-N-acetylglucosamine 2-epimerase (non-hydrolysing)
VGEVLAGRGKTGRVAEFWDGKASGRIAAELYTLLCAQPARAPA